MASGFPAVTLLVTIATAPATVPRSAVAALDSMDGLGGVFRSRRRRTAAERAAVFFLAAVVDAPLGVLRVFFFPADFRDLFRVVFFATLTSAPSARTVDAGKKLF